MIYRFIGFKEVVIQSACKGWPTKVGKRLSPLIILVVPGVLKLDPASPTVFLVGNLGVDVTFRSLPTALDASSDVLRNIYK